MERDGNLDFESAMGYFSNMFPTLTKQTIKDILESLKISENLRVVQSHFIFEIMLGKSRIWHTTEIEC